MKIPFVDLNAQYLSIKDKIDSAIANVIAESGFVRSHFVDEFELQWAKTIGVKHCISCGNGTDAIYIVLKGLGIGLGDEVITTAHSWISTSETITQAGARVVFVDTEPDTFCINPQQIEKKITKRTKAIIPVHLYGHPADMDPIMDLAKKYGLKVIEDCAQAHLAKYKGRTVGTLGDASTFSFYPGKNLGAMGDAGCILTNNSSLAEFCATYARHGGKNEHIIEGINSRMDGLQAAILNEKIKFLHGWTNKRRKVAARYTKELSANPAIICPKEQSKCEHVYHLYVIRHKKRNELKEYLSKHGVDTVLNYPRALPFYPAYHYLGHRTAEFPVAHHHSNQILSLPIFPELETAAQDYIINKILSFSEKF